MTVYKRCPFCDELFAIGAEDDAPMRRHMEDAHGELGRPPSPPETASAISFQDVRRALEDEASPRGVLLACVFKRDVLTEVFGQWYGVPESAVEAQFDLLEADLFEEAARSDDESF
ncbi:hypothetical protein ACFPYI_06435 [Halomarina salina]|uniref:C2H2-type domain-containing protein n=1 Tax=Halomarina salina TaxID=1872699 RepID=A0ABD5RKU3_9EURY|nr:hypothetical protein [Halomarina salina]